MDHLMEQLFDLEQQEAKEYKALLQAVLEREFFGSYLPAWGPWISFQDYLYSQA